MNKKYVSENWDNMPESQADGYPYYKYPELDSSVSNNVLPSIISEPYLGWHVFRDFNKTRIKLDTILGYNRDEQYPMLILHLDNGHDLKIDYGEDKEKLMEGSARNGRNGRVR